MMPHKTAPTFIALWCFLVSGCLAPSAEQPVTPSSPSNDTVRLAAWNVEHLADDNGEGCRARTDDDYAVMRTYIDQVDADIWFLQEVENEAAIARVFGDGWAVYVDDRAVPNTNWPACYDNPDQRLGMQRTAIVVRNGIEHRRLPDLNTLDVEGYGGLRPGVRVTLEGDHPIELISLHLKSGCFTGRERDACPILFEQLGILEAWIDEQSANGQPVIMAGDFNRRVEMPGDEFWNDLNDGNPSSLQIAGAGTGPRCNPRYREFIDFIVFNDMGYDAYVVGSFNETTFAEEPDHQPSDHCPIAVDVLRE